MEEGTIVCSPNELRRLLGVLGLTDAGRIGTLLADARRLHRNRMWWAAPELRHGMSRSLRRVIEFELEATSVHCISGMGIPTVLQTAEYADAVSALRLIDNGDEERRTQLRIQQRRRYDLTKRSDPLAIRAIIYESALVRQPGGPQILRGQLQDLLNLQRSGRLSVRVIPFSCPIVVMVDSELIDIDYGNSGESGLYQESIGLDEFTRDRSRITKYRRLFESMWTIAMDDVTSVQAIQIAHDGVGEEDHQRD